MKRKIVNIDETKCDGCGLCIPNCHEGALQIIDGKARLISDLFCDGLGACLGFCPQGAIKIEEREAEPYDERKVMGTIVLGGRNVIIAHLTHLMEHNEMEYLNQAFDYLQDHGIEITKDDIAPKLSSHCGCPGSKEMVIEKEEPEEKAEDTSKRESELRQWPIQLHLVNPAANYYRNSDLLLAADCTAFAAGDFHKDYMKGKSIAIACPKLDQGKEIYLQKLISMITDAQIKSMTVLIMQVPCCGGLLQLAEAAVKRSGKQIPINYVVIGIDGSVLEEDTI